MTSFARIRIAFGLAALHLPAAVSMGASDSPFTTAKGIYSASDEHVRFGLGAETIIACVEIARRSGIVQRVEKPGINQVLHITETAP